MSEKIQPKVRFFGFTDAWEERKLIDIAGNLSDGDWIEANHIFDNGKYRIVQTGNIGIGSFLDKLQHAKYFHQADFDELKANEIFPGDILISRLSDPAGRTAIFPDLEVRAVTSVDVAIIRPADNFNSDFLVSELNSSIILAQVDSLASGSTRKRISRKNLEGVKISIPTVEEQRKIGSFFEQLDKTIDLHQSKLEELKTVKKLAMQKIFDQEWRFKGFTDPWEQCKLGKLGSFIRNSIFPQKFSNDEFVEYSMPAFDDGKRPKAVSGIMMQSGRLKISGEVLLINKLNVRQRRIWLVENANHNAVASGEFMPFISDKVVLSFLEQLLLSDRTTRDLESISSGTSNSQKRVTPSDLLGYKIQISSSKTEQTQIATLLKDLDSLIAANQQKCDQLKKVKKWCMQNLFV